MLKKYLNRPFFILSAVAVSAISAFAVGTVHQSPQGVTLQKPTIEMTAVAGTSRVITIVKAEPTDSVVYRTSDTIATYHEPFLLEKSDTILARTCFTDTTYNSKGEQVIKRYYSQYDTLYVEAGTEVKLNPVSFDQNMLELEDDLSFITLHTDQSDVLFSPEATIMYRMTNRTWIEVPNDSTILSNEGTIAAYAKAPGYANSDTVFYNVKIQRIEYVGVPSVEILSHNVDGSKKILIKNTVEGYPVPTIYYSFPTGAEPKILEDSILVTPADSYGWLQVYADAPGYDASDSYKIYLDNRTRYHEPYVTVTPTDTELPASAGDLELWNVSELNVINYPEQKVSVSGNIIYHKTMHSNYNTLVLPFLYNPRQNPVTDGAGRALELGTDFFLYELSTTLSAERLENGSLDADLVYPFKCYLVKVAPRLIGQEMVFRSVEGTPLEVVQSTFSAASSSLMMIPNARAQKHQLSNSCYVINEAGTAFELKETPMLNSFEVGVFAPYDYQLQNPVISLVYQPELQFDPANGAEMDSLYTIKVSAPSSMNRLVLRDEEYKVGGSKHLNVLKNGAQSSITAQLNKKDNKTYEVVLSNVVKAEARYAIQFPEGLFGFFTAGNDTSNPDHLSKESAVIYNVMQPTTVTIDPAVGAQNSLKDFTLTFNKQIGLNNKGAITFENAAGDTLVSFTADDVRSHSGWLGSNKLKLSLPNKITSGGTYILRIPVDFLTLSGVFTNSKPFSFSYNLPVVRHYRNFDEDVIMWTNYDNINAAYNDGWVSSDTTANGRFSFSFEVIPNYIMLIDPATRQSTSKPVSTVKVGKAESEKLHFHVKNVKTVIFYACNTGSWAYALDIRAVSPSAILTNYVSIDSYRSAYCQMDIDPDEEVTVTAYSNAVPLNVYAVEFVYRDGSIAGAGIETVFDDDDASQRIFDMQGREIAAPVKGQMYIRNGKKFIER